MTIKGYHVLLVLWLTAVIAWRAIATGDMALAPFVAAGAATFAILGIYYAEYQR